MRTSSFVFIVSLLLGNTAFANQLSQDLFMERLEQADLVVVGEIIRIEPVVLDSQQLSEHNPEWHTALLKPILIEVGGEGFAGVALAFYKAEIGEINIGDIDNTGGIYVHFPNSLDVAWYNAPKFAVGQLGIFILKKIDGHLAYTALNSLDFFLFEEGDDVTSRIAELEQSIMQTDWCRVNQNYHPC